MNAADAAPVPATEVAPAAAVSVRALCEFVARSGDLDRRYGAGPSAQEGIAGHLRVSARRAPGYQRERRLSACVQGLRVSGRADGYDPDTRTLEEIKTYRGRLDRLPPNQRALHWAQLRCYGALLCAELGLVRLRLVLVYFDIDRGQETPLAEEHDAVALRDFLDDCCRRYRVWALQEGAHRAARDAALAALAFPHAAFQPGQHRLAAATYRCLRDGGRLLLQAPTGIGKTMGTVFPALKACAGGRIDRIVYLAARTTGRQLALDALARVRAASAEALPLRVLELVARDRACVHPDKACHGDSCPLARGYYDRLPAARAAALARRTLDRAGLQAVAAAHAVCPYFLGQELARWCDVVVGDYHYYFDTGALLHALAVESGWRVALLVDEAHNLVDRGRAMFSAALDQRRLDAVRAVAAPARRAPRERLHRAWNALHREQTEVYRALDAVPAAFCEALDAAAAALGEGLAGLAEPPDPQVQEFHYALLRFAALAGRFDTHSLCDLTLSGAARGRRRSTLCIRNLVPAPFLAEKLGSAHAAVLFSATLRPAEYLCRLAGLPEDTALVELPSPFSAQQLAVRAETRISTRYADRAGSLRPIAALIAAQFHARPGNYLAFFSSFEYLDAVAAELARAHPDIPAWRQSRGMDETQRGAFLARFEEAGRGVGFAVLGGPFAEGIDLPGRRLIGAFVATLGLPQVNAVNERIRARLDELLGSGYEYTYLYPGLQKVVQAAGRVVRHPDDRGVLVLIDARYARASVRRLLPDWWGLDAVVG